MRRALTVVSSLLCVTASLWCGNGVVPHRASGGSARVSVVTTIVLTVDSPVMLVDGVRTALEVAPVIRNDRTLVPVRRVAEALAATVSYVPSLHQISIVRAGLNLSLTIGVPTAVMNGRSVSIDPADTRVVPILSAGRTMVPLRFIAESLGSTVSYEPRSRTITIVWRHTDGGS